ncbi:MAG: cytochrome c biogenesis protein CcsA [Crocinitomicaceae bacterium]
MKKSLNKILSMPLMVLFLLIFFLAIGAATFIENDFGREIAYKWVYKANWFTFVLFYLSISLLYNVFRYRMFQKRKFSSLLFHLAFLVIVIGAAVTRYTGFEGMMLIREGESSNEIITAETYLQIKVHDNIDQYVYDMPITVDTNEMAYVYPGIKGGNPFTWMKNLLFDHNNYFEHAFDFKDKRIEIVTKEVMLHAKDTIIPDVQGSPHIELVTGGMDGRTYHYIDSGQVKQFENGLKVAFNTVEFTDAVKIMETDSGIHVMSPYDMQYIQMSDQSEGIIVRDSLQVFHTKRLYIIGGAQFAFNQYYPGARVETIESKDAKNNLQALRLMVSDGEQQKEVFLKGGKGLRANKVFFRLGDLFFVMGYGSKVVEVPFSLYLRDFELERYPGTENPSSFASEVTLVDPEEGLEEDYRIFMNNVLDYGGYRFFQSSYDPDEKGTRLSVNHDTAGTILTYIGYLLLALGFVMNLISPNSRFRKLAKRGKALRKKREQFFMIFLLLGFSFNGFSNELPLVDKEHAAQFSRLQIQHYNGRFQPVHTLAYDILKKVHRGVSYKEMDPVQVFIGIQTYPAWYQEPLIYVSGSPLQEKYNLDGKYAALSDFIFIGEKGITYLLQEEADKARRKKPAERSQYDKDVLKTDERLNIMFGVFNYSYLKIFPKPNDPENRWFAPYELQGQFSEEDSTFVSGVMKIYVAAVNKGYKTGEWSDANKVVDLIDTYQQKTASAEVLLSPTKIAWEVWYNQFNIFKRLMNWYVGLGFVLLIMAFIQLFVPKLSLKWPIRIGTLFFAVLWGLHGFGLGLRWYLSGHAPWSNGYEAVVFIAFVTVLAGLIFSRQSKIVLGATGILAWLMLFVAHMNQLDPEITNLVPVLKSYWLMIHVAIITGSYGFLGLGAIMSLIVMIMYWFVSPSNYQRILLTTKELTQIVEMTLTIGLFMLTIGTFLGGVWANESWGRYWGWDAKETWALASVLIYAVVLHLRFIPFMKGQYSFNLWSFWAYSSIIMTFFGVNFYLSGLHSYAQGDPIPIPTWVPWSIAILGLISLISFIRWKHIKRFLAEKREELE